MRSVTQAQAIHLRLMVRFPRKDLILFQLGLKVAELPCFESETEHRSAEALEDNHRLLLQCGNWKFNFFGNCYEQTKSSHKTSRPSLTAHAICTQDLVHRHLAASTRVQLHQRSATSTRPRQRRAPPRDIVLWLHQLIVDYSSSGRTSSTSTLP
jgi:hypothetical protein